jgi:hypothetical protein
VIVRCRGASLLCAPRLGCQARGEGPEAPPYCISTSAMNYN